MYIDFDDCKNRRNIVERSLSFEDVPRLNWNEALIIEDTRKEYGEKRMIAIVPDEKGVVHIVVYTRRRNVYWIISFRRANKRERRMYDDNKNQSGET
ncbi:BrnT family toxin [bacterium]|nr:BrnT family toxin [bacterium]